MKIELGNFGYSRPDVVAPAEKSQVVEAVGNAGFRISAAEQEAQRNREAFQRATAANEFAKYQLALEDVGRGVEQDMATGVVSWDQADAEYGKRADKIPAPEAKLDSRIDQENQQAAVSHARERTRQSLAPSIFQNRQRTGAAMLDDFLDTQAKRAIEPGANIDQINASADAFGANAREYGLPENVISARLQNFKDANWYNSALQRTVDSDGNLPALKGVLADITNPKGIYAGKLDPTKRASLQASVQNQIDRIELRAQAAGDRRDARAERALVQYERQMSTGIPATPESLNGWSEAVRGTPSQAEFEELTKSEQEIQTTLKMPVADQVRMVQQRKADLEQNGGTVAQVANAARLDNAVKSNVKLLTQAPILFGEQRLGDQNQPLDLGDFASDAGRQKASVVIAERANRIHALEKQFGVRVQMSPLLPQEASALTDALNGATPDRATQMFGTLAAVTKDPLVYRGIMQQIAPDSPVRAYAGQVFAYKSPVTPSTNSGGPDQRVTNAVVASNIVQGEAIINKTREQKGEDGKPVKNLYMPNKDAFDMAFSAHVGDAFADRPDALDLAQQVGYAYYVGKSAKAGRLNEEGVKIDDNLMEETLHLAIGDVSNFHGFRHVILPLGMDTDQFQVATRDQFLAEVGGDQRVANDAWRSLGLRNLDANRYVVTKGRDDFKLKGRKIIIDLTKPLPAGVKQAPLSDQFVPM